MLRMVTVFPSLPCTIASRSPFALRTRLALIARLAFPLVPTRIDPASTGANTFQSVIDEIIGFRSGTIRVGGGGGRRG